MLEVPENGMWRLGCLGIKRTKSWPVFLSASLHSGYTILGIVAQPQRGRGLAGPTLGLKGPLESIGHIHNLQKLYTGEADMH